MSRLLHLLSSSFGMVALAAIMAWSAFMHVRALDAGFAAEPSVGAADVPALIESAPVAVSEEPLVCGDLPECD